MFHFVVVRKHAGGGRYHSPTNIRYSAHNSPLSVSQCDPAAAGSIMPATIPYPLLALPDSPWSADHFRELSLMCVTLPLGDCLSARAPAPG